MRHGIRAPGFRDKVTALAAPIHGKPKDQLASDDLREQRRSGGCAQRVAGLAVLTVIAVVAAVVAVSQRQNGRPAAQRAQSHSGSTPRPKAMLAGTRPGGDVVRSRNCWPRARSPRPMTAPCCTRSRMRATTAKIIDTGATSHDVAFSPDGHRLATAGERRHRAGCGTPPPASPSANR